MRIKDLGGAVRPIIGCQKRCWTTTAKSAIGKRWAKDEIAYMLVGYESAREKKSRGEKSQRSQRCCLDGSNLPLGY